MESPKTDHLASLGSDTDYKYAGADAKLLERFENPMAQNDCNLAKIKIVAPEFTSVCPKTGQPDFATIVVEYAPREWCVESKSLKLYLWGFRDRAVFAEALAAEIAGEIMTTAKPQRVTVTLTQRPRGGIEVRAVSELTA